jgi:hypothetical protein
MITKVLLETENAKVSCNKNVIVKPFTESLKGLIDNISSIINDPTLNRLMRQLGYEAMKGMSSSATTGYGASAGFYIVKGETLIKLLNNQIDSKKIDIVLENKKQNPNTIELESHLTIIEMLISRIEYFTKQSEKYFIINGQHRLESIKSDFNGLIEIPKSKKDVIFDYSKLIYTEDGKTHTEHITSLHQLKKKLCSADSSVRFEWCNKYTKSEREAIYNNYLEYCQVYVYEISEASSFQSVMEFIKRSNQSAEWDDFLYDSLSSFSAYSKWFGEEMMPARTNEYSSYQELIYGENSPLKFGKGSFRVADGGYQYLIGTLMNTCYTNPSLLSKFEVKQRPDISKSLFADDSPFIKSWGTDLLTDISKVMAAIISLSNNNNAKVFKEVYEKPSFLIYCVFALNYYKKVYKYTNGKEKWKLNLKDDNVYEFVKDMVLIFFAHSSIAEDANTNYWNTPEGINVVERWKAKKAFDSDRLAHPLSIKDLLPEFQQEWSDIEPQFEKNETKDKEKSFRRHFIGDLTSWGYDHSCIVNVLNQYVEQAFIETKIEMIDPNTLTNPSPFSKIGFVSCTSLPKVSKLVTSNMSDLYNLLNSTEETDRVHTKARAKGGSSSAANINIGNRKINRKQKAVV